MPTYGGTLKRIGGTALNLGVYLPVGATLKAKDLLTSRERLFGEFEGFVDRGRQTLSPILGRQRLERVRVDVKTRTKEARGEMREMGARAQRAKQQAKGTARTAAARAGAAPSVEDLPIARYDDLTAQEIIDHLPGLTQEEVQLIRTYERRHENRSTVVQALDSRLVKLPISSYDEMTADEVVRALGDLSPEQLRKVRDYESRTKARQTVLERIETLLAA